MCMVRGKNGTPDANNRSVVEIIFYVRLAFITSINLKHETVPAVCSMP